VVKTQAAGTLDMSNSQGQTVLMYAAMHGLGSVVEMLLDAGTKAEVKDEGGMTALALVKLGHMLLLFGSKAAGQRHFPTSRRAAGSWGC